jgi:hypothetical protein
MWLFFGSVALLLSVISVFVFRRRYRHSGDSTFIVIDVDGQNQTLSYESKQHTHKGSNTSYFLSLACRSPATLAIHRESSFDRFGKRLGTREFTFRDQELDNALFLDSNDQRIEQMFAAHEQARQALKTRKSALDLCALQRRLAYWPCACAIVTRAAYHRACLKQFYARQKQAR